MVTTVEGQDKVLPLEITEKNITIENLHTDHINKIKFDLSIQRGKVWTIKQKSLFLYTIMVGYRFPELFAQNLEGHWFILDGKQRMSTVFDFLDGQFELDASTPDVYGEKVAGLDYQALPQHLKRKINSTVFSIVFFENMTLEQRDEMFYLLNNGSKLSALEKNRSKYSAILGDIKKIADMPFFAKMVNFSKSAREGMADQELVYSLSLLLDKGKKHNGLGSKKIENYIDELKAENRTINVEALENIANYLQEAFKDFTITDCKRSLKRADVVAIFIVAKRCVEDGESPERFGAFIQDYFANLDNKGKYALTRRAGSTKKENINKRINILDKAFMEWIVKESIQTSQLEAAASVGELEKTDEEVSDGETVISDSEQLNNNTDKIEELHSTEETNDGETKKTTATNKGTRSGKNKK